MTHYMVWGAERRPQGFMGATFLDWSQPPLGVYEGDTPEDACKSAMVDHGKLSTFFAIEGFAWGIALMEENVKKLGAVGSPAERNADRVTQLLERAAEREEAINKLLLERGDKNEDDQNIA